MKKARNRRHNTDLDLIYLSQLWDTQGGFCALSGLPMHLPRNSLAWEKDTRNPWKPSLDRTDSSIGYVRGNVRYVVMMANLAKHQFTDEELLKLCRAIVNNHPS
jgi:hypothetical protein